jgi:DNA-binding transcriptional LysR family regulator
LRNQRIKPRLVVTSNAAAVEAALADFGLTRLLSYQVAPQLAEGSLQIVLEEFEPRPRPIHIVHREERFASPTVRSFIDFATARLRSNSLLH